MLSALATADVNNDGRADIVTETSNLSQHRVVTLINLGSDPMGAWLGLDSPVFSPLVQSPIYVNSQRRPRR